MAKMLRIKAIFPISIHLILMQINFMPSIGNYWLTQLVTRPMNRVVTNERTMGYDFHGVRLANNSNFDANYSEEYHSHLIAMKLTKPEKQFGSCGGKT
jgi:hypothetical protein